MPEENSLLLRFGDIDVEIPSINLVFYQTDNLLGPLYPPEDLAGAEYRLRSFLIFRFGGPDRYLHERGHPQLRMRHAPFAIDQTVRDRWVLLMDQALVEAELPAAAVAIVQPFLQEIATFLINRGAKPNLVT